MKTTTISYTNDKRIIKDQQALVSLETQIIETNDKEDDGVLFDNIKLIYASLMSDHKRIRTWVEVGGEPFANFSPSGQRGKVQNLFKFNMVGWRKRLCQIDQSRMQAI